LKAYSPTEHQYSIRAELLTIKTINPDSILNHVVEIKQSVHDLSNYYKKFFTGVRDPYFAKTSLLFSKISIPGVDAFEAFTGASLNELIGLERVVNFEMWQRSHCRPIWHAKKYCKVARDV
uniref:Ras-GEF domain-containing protein n=1 Tax=Brugia timori TaxID=42155 RepID=A0A0R3R0W0_9BILA